MLFKSVAVVLAFAAAAIAGGSDAAPPSTWCVASLVMDGHAWNLAWDNDTNSLNSRGAFKNVMIIVLENEDNGNVLADPYLGSVLPAKGQLLTNMDAVWHPSQPNYIAMISGSKRNVLLDNDANIDAPNVADLLEAKGFTWRAYQEEYPGNCFSGSSASNKLYRRKHNPFISFNSIRNNAARCGNIVPASYLDIDAKARNLPNYMFYTPNMDNDGHDTTLAYSSAWLKGFLEPKLVDPAYADTLFVVTYDESESYLARNQIYTVLLGKGIKGKNLKDNTYYTHYSVLKAIEQNFQIGNMGKHDSEAGTNALDLAWAAC
ncbi:hypothetical protein HDU96_000642 [Phlyctochytrium bullatum]|nr:hypothetical protein HDU96_000642 [Phlyctochytrium bullatum]